MFDDVPTNLPTGQSDPVPTPAPAPMPSPTSEPTSPIIDEGVELHGSPDGTVSMPEPAEPVAPVVAQESVAAAAPSPAVEDLFADVQEPVSGNVAMPSTTPVAGGGASGGKTKKMILIAVVVLVVLGAIGAAAMVLMSGSKDSLDIPDASVTPTTIPEVAEPESPTDDVLPNDKLPEVTPPVEEIDTDNDGLTDAEEIRYGTMINKPDSDSDGLFDREEVMIYRTNPLVADTDGDGFLDGAEVQSGYDPNGPGRLTTTPQ